MFSLSQTPCSHPHSHTHSHPKAAQAQPLSDLLATKQLHRSSWGIGAPLLWLGGSGPCSRDPQSWQVLLFQCPPRFICFEPQACDPPTHQSFRPPLHRGLIGGPLQLIVHCYYVCCATQKQNKGSEMHSS